MVTKPKGYPKTGGRQKGSSFAGQLRKELQEKGLDLVKMFFEDLEGVGDSHKRCELILRFMDFVYPKPRVDVALSVKDMEPEEFKEFMKDGLARIRTERVS